MDNQERIIDPAEEALSRISGGRILDVATGNGGFISLLTENLLDYIEIVGIDTNERTLETARRAYPLENICFRQMDAIKMDFNDSSFDIVCIANSLHHMADLNGVLAEMLRVCKPGGHIIVNEMFCDDQRATQLTHVYLHHWWAAIDTVQGITHYKTFTRKQILKLWGKINIHNIAQCELKDLEADPKDPELVRQLDKIIDRYIQRVQNFSSGSKLRKRGLQLRKRIHQVGFHAATTLFLIGKK